MPVAMHRTANGPQLEWHIEFSESLVAFKHTLTTPHNWWTSETDYSVRIQQQKRDLIRKNATQGASARNGGSSCTKESGRAHPTWSRYKEHVKFTPSQTASCGNVQTLEAVAFQRPSRSTSISALDTEKAFLQYPVFWHSSFTPNRLLSTSVSPSPLLSWVHSSWQINSLKRLPVWCNSMFLNTVFSGALLQKFNLLRNRSDAINRTKQMFSVSSWRKPVLGQQ